MGTERAGQESVCKCHENFFGLDCSLRHCPNSTRGYQCDNHGTCDHPTGFCKCTGDHYGPTCEFKKCPRVNGRVCNGQGVCHASTWEGALGTMSEGNITDFQGKKHTNFRIITDCQTTPDHRMPDSSSGSICRPKTGQKDGVCSCRWPYYGEKCDMKLCPNSANENSGTGLECDGHGTCDRVNGVCQCYPGHFGKDCHPRLCPFSANNAMGVSLECNGEGSCDRTWGRCKCHNPRYFGQGCEKKRCPSYPGDSNDIKSGDTENYNTPSSFEEGYARWPNECGGVERGECDITKGVCVCKTGFFGHDCAQKGTGTAGATQRRMGLHLDVKRPLRQDETLRDQTNWHYGGMGTQVPGGS